MFYEEEEGEGREVREGGTSERERATILSIERERLPVLHRYEEEEEVTTQSRANCNAG